MLYWGHKCKWIMYIVLSSCFNIILCYNLSYSSLSTFFKYFIYFIFTEGKGGRKRETSMCGCLSSAPYWGPGLQPRHVPWLGLKLVTLWFTGRHSIHRATPARTLFNMFFISCSIFPLKNQHIFVLFCFKGLLCSF